MKLKYTIAALAATTMAANAAVINWADYTNTSSTAATLNDGVTSTSVTMVHTGAFFVAPTVNTFATPATTSSGSYTWSGPIEHQYGATATAIGSETVSTYTAAFTPATVVWIEGLAGQTGSVFEYTVNGTDWLLMNATNGWNVTANAGSLNSGNDKTTAFNETTAEVTTASGNGAGVLFEAPGAFVGFRVTSEKLIAGSADNTNLTIGVVAVPEPSSTALLGLGGLALILRRRK